MENYNLLVTYHPNRAGLAEREIRQRVEDAGGDVDELVSSCINGVMCVRVSDDAKRIVSNIRDEFREAPAC